MVLRLTSKQAKGFQIGQSSKQRGVLLACLLISKSVDIDSCPAGLLELKSRRWNWRQIWRNEGSVEDFVWTICSLGIFTDFVIPWSDEISSWYALATLRWGRSILEVGIYLCCSPGLWAVLSSGWRRMFAAGVFGGQSCIWCHIWKVPRWSFRRTCS